MRPAPCYYYNPPAAAAWSSARRCCAAWSSFCFAATAARVCCNCSCSPAAADSSFAALVLPLEAGGAMPAGGPAAHAAALAAPAAAGAAPAVGGTVKGMQAMLGKLASMMRHTSACSAAPRHSSCAVPSPCRGRGHAGRGWHAGDAICLHCCLTEHPRPWRRGAALLSRGLKCGVWVSRRDRAPWPLCHDCAPSTGRPAGPAHLRAHPLAAMDEVLDGWVRQHGMQHGAGQLGGAERRRPRGEEPLRLAHQRAQLQGGDRWQQQGACFKADRAYTYAHGMHALQGQQGGGLSACSRTCQQQRMHTPPTCSTSPAAISASARAVMSALMRPSSSTHARCSGVVGCGKADCNGKGRSTSQGPGGHLPGVGRAAATCSRCRPKGHVSSLHMCALGEDGEGIGIAQGPPIDRPTQPARRLPGPRLACSPSRMTTVSLLAARSTRTRCSGAATAAPATLSTSPSYVMSTGVEPKAQAWSILPHCGGSEKGTARLVQRDQGAAGWHPAPLARST